MLPRGGDVVFGIAHQHSGGIGASVLPGRAAVVRDGYLRPRGMRPGTRRATLSA
jgi:allantoicase